MLRKQKYILLRGAIIVIASVYLIWKGIVPGWSIIQSDFPNYYVSAKIVVAGNAIEKLYDDLWFQEQIAANGIDVSGKFSPQPPVTSLIMIPITFLNPINAKRTWLIISIILMLGSIFIVSKTFSLSLIDSSMAMLLMGNALSNDIRLGQLYIMVVFGMLLSLWLAKYKHAEVLAGVILGIVTILKYFPVLLLGYFLINKKYKLVISAVLSIAAIGVFQTLYFGWDLVSFYLKDILLSHLSGDIPGQGGFAFSFQSWPVFLNNIFVYHPVLNVKPLINWPAGKVILLTTICGTVILATWTYIGRLKKSTHVDSLDNHMMLGILVIAGLTLLPASASYHMIFLLIPLATVLNIQDHFLKAIIVFMIFAINFLPMPFAGDDNLFVLVLSFPRLMALMATFVMYCYLLKLVAAGKIGFVYEVKNK